MVNISIVLSNVKQQGLWTEEHSRYIECEYLKPGRVTV